MKLEFYNLKKAHHWVTSRL